MLKKITLLLILTLSLFIISCGGSKNELTFVLYAGAGENYMQYSNSITKAYKEVNPDVNLKLEIIPATEYDKIMQIRANSQKLPDIFVTRVVSIRSYAEYLEPLDDLNAAKNNLYASDYAVDGKIYGIPMRGFHEYVYYNKKIFSELGLSVPQTWQEFLDLIKKINENGKYIPLALGGKDSWATYPFAEFMPYLVKNGDDVYTKMGAAERPFDEGNPVREAYSKIKEMLALKPAGEDPFGYGFTQASDMLFGEQAAMLAAGQWFYIEAKENLDEEQLSNIGVFYLPVRDSISDPFRYLITAEVFVGVTKDSPRKEEAKKFVEWLFNSEYYKDLVKNEDVIPTVKDIPYEGSPIFTEAFEILSNNNPESVIQLPGDAQYDEIKNYAQFNVKDIGQELLTSKTLEEICNEWSQKWSDARKALNIK